MTPSLWQGFYSRTNVQYTGREWCRILEFYRAWVNTIPSGNKPAVHYEGSECPDHFIWNSPDGMINAADVLIAMQLVHTYAHIRAYGVK